MFANPGEEASLVGPDGTQRGRGEEGSDGQRVGTVGMQCSGMVRASGFTEAEWAARARYGVLKMEK